jgi:hypothetical protein
MNLDAETLKAAAPILIALFSLIGLIVTSYFTYKANVNATAAKATADQVSKETQGIRRAFLDQGKI